MNDTLKELIKLIYNDHKVTTILIVTLCVTMWLLSKILNSKSIVVMFETRFRLDIDKHPVFQNEKRLQAMINRYTNLDKNKQDLYRSIMTITKDDSYAYINEMKLKNFFDKESFVNSINYNVPILNSRKRFIDYCRTGYGKNGEDLANYILDEFELIRSRSLQALELNLNLLSTENFKTINQAKYFFFSIGYATLEQSIIDAEISFQNMNGKIKKIIEKQ